MGVKAKGEGLAPVEDCWPGEEVSRHLLLLLQDLNEAHTLSSLEERATRTTHHSSWMIAEIFQHELTAVINENHLELLARASV